MSVAYLLQDCQGNSKPKIIVATPTLDSLIEVANTYATGQIKQGFKRPDFQITQFSVDDDNLIRTKTMKYDFVIGAAITVSPEQADAI